MINNSKSQRTYFFSNSQQNTLTKISINVPQVFRSRFLSSFFSGGFSNNECNLYFNFSNFEGQYRQLLFFLTLNASQIKSRQEYHNFPKCICVFCWQWLFFLKKRIEEGHTGPLQFPPKVALSVPSKYINLKLVTFFTKMFGENIFFDYVFMKFAFLNCKICFRVTAHCRASSLSNHPPPQIVHLSSTINT